MNAATTPDQITRLFVERSNAGDPDGVAALYADDGVLAYPAGQVTIGRDAIRDLWAEVLSHRPHFEHEPPLPGESGFVARAAARAGATGTELLTGRSIWRISSVVRSATIEMNDASVVTLAKLANEHHNYQDGDCSEHDATDVVHPSHLSSGEEIRAERDWTQGRALPTEAANNQPKLFSIAMI